jgi:hypothetical protein
MTLEQLAKFAEFLGLLIILVTLVFLTLRIRLNTTYRFAAVLGLAAAFILVWVNLSVGIIGEPDDLFNLMYVGVLAVGIIGAIIARFRPHGMARAMFAAALAQALVAVIVLSAGLSAPKPKPGVMLIFNGFFVALFVGSAWLFRKAAREHPPADEKPEG